MEKIKTLRRYGLFDAKVPRYTSYPPANRFELGVGQIRQKEWLRTLDPSKPVSIYVHIPFCRRLCWFCACRTQGTQTMRPVDDYLSTVLKEISTVSGIVPAGLQMERLHLGGGTPTLLSGRQMRRLLQGFHDAFRPTGTFEFSVEIDPTDASDDVLEELAKWRLGRASVGVQDFDPKVQKAIGRQQSVEQTERVTSGLRSAGVQSLNIDLLYGLPFQTEDSLLSTLTKVVSQRPDRLALYGYAHVPHMSKRQVMIDASQLPDAERRYHLARLAADQLEGSGYESLGIDHFALPHDSLAHAKANQKMKRNFQGYTDDPCETLLAFGASAISRFKQGYVQNAVATATYRDWIGSKGLAGHKGYAMSATDNLISHLIEGLMCNGSISLDQIPKVSPAIDAQMREQLDQLAARYSEAFEITEGRLTLAEDYVDLARIVAAELDGGIREGHVHSLAI